MFSVKHVLHCKLKLTRRLSSLHSSFGKQRSGRLIALCPHPTHPTRHQHTPHATWSHTSVLSTANHGRAASTQAFPSCRFSLAVAQAAAHNVALSLHAGRRERGGRFRAASANARDAALALACASRSRTKQPRTCALERKGTQGETRRSKETQASAREDKERKEQSEKPKRKAQAPTRKQAAFAGNARTRTGARPL